MLRLLSDENVNSKLLKALFQQCPTLDLVRVQEVGLRQKPDMEILAWAAEERRILITQDRSSMTDHIRDRHLAGDSIAGVWIIKSHATHQDIIECILIAVECTTNTDWIDQVQYFPY